MALSYVLLQKVTLSTSAASVTLSNIPQTGYTDLKIVISSRDARTGVVTSDILFNFNGTGVGTSVSGKYAYGTGSGVTMGSISGGNLAFGAAAANTASVYGSSEVYIPNYLATDKFKTIISDNVSENNGTGGFQLMVSGLWASNSAINSISMTPYTSPFSALSEFSLYGIAAVGTTPTAAPFATGGDLITNDGTYWIHTFLSSGVFTPTKTLNCDYLVVAGGGGSGGGSSWGGTPGGGAGGYRSFTAQSLTQGTPYNAIIGAGGAGGVAPSSGGGNNGTNGTNSVFNFNAATGGGASTATNGNSGGSGGGAYGYPDGTYTGGAGNTPSTSPSQGNNGGLGKSDNTIYTHSGGGGGAGQVGGNATTTRGGLGGNGIASSITGTSTYYAGGGGGGAASNTGTSNAAGGLGGGGAGKYISGTAGDAGTINTGGGAGGSAGFGGSVSGAAGGSGIVIIRYPMV